MPRLETKPSPPPLPSYILHLCSIPLIGAHSNVTIKKHSYQRTGLSIRVQTLVNPLRPPFPPTFQFHLLRTNSFVIQQRLPLPVSADDITLLPEAQLLPESTRNCDNESGNKQKGHDHKGKDPLQRDNLDTELMNGKC